MTASAPKDQSLPQASLYVGDLHPLVTESMLYATFSQMGHVLSARVCRDVARQSSLGYGYVNFENPKDAERALEQLIYENIMGRQIRIMWCVRDPSLRKSGKGNIFIKNLDKSINQKDLYDTFSHFGKILSCKIAFDDNGNSKGYGFIHFENEECAKLAIESVNGKLINDRMVYVGPFIPKTQRKVSAGKPKFNNCYVKNFGQEMTDDDLRKMFEEFGEIKSACVMKDDQNRSKGFGFVCFTDPASAEKAVETLNGKDINGQTLYVSRAQRKEERQEILRQQFEKQRNERLAKYNAGINLYVKNLDDTIDDARLKEAFSKYGKITSAKVMMDNNGTSKGFGFVCFTSPEEAKEALKLNGTLLGTKPLYVALAQRREDRKVKLLAEHQQRMQYRSNAANIPPTAGLPNFFGQNPYNATQRFYPTSTLGPGPRWNRSAMTGPQVQLGQPPFGAAPALRPTLNPPYVGTPGALAAMGQSQLAQGNLMNTSFRAQPANRNMMQNSMPSLGSGAPNGVVGGPGPQQYGAQRPNISGQMLGPSGPVPRQTMAAVAGGIRQAQLNQAVRPMAQPSVPVGPLNANVRFNQGPRGVGQPQASRPVASPVRSTFNEQGDIQGSTSAQLQQASDDIKKDASMDKQRQELGDKLYQKIAKINPELAGKITGMLLQMGQDTVENTMKSDESLQKAVETATSALAKREAEKKAQAGGQ